MPCLFLPIFVAFEVPYSVSIIYLLFIYLLWESYTRYTRNTKTRHNRITANEAESTQCKHWAPKT